METAARAVGPPRRLIIRSHAPRKPVGASRHGDTGLSSRVVFAGHHGRGMLLAMSATTEREA